MKITKRKLSEILRESIFTPSAPGPMKVISEVGGSDYYVRRAVELCMTFLTDPKIVYLTQAISLLAMAKLQQVDFDKQVSSVECCNGELDRKDNTLIRRDCSFHRLDKK